MSRVILALTFLAALALAVWVATTVLSSEERNGGRARQRREFEKSAKSAKEQDRHRLRSPDSRGDLSRILLSWDRDRSGVSAGPDFRRTLTRPSAGTLWAGAEITYEILIGSNAHHARPRPGEKLYEPLEFLDPESVRVNENAVEMAGDGFLWTVPSCLSTNNLVVRVSGTLRRAASAEKEMTSSASDPAAELKALEDRWHRYDSDLDAILSRPLMRRLSEPAVQDVVRARARARAVDSGDRPGLAAAVAEFSAALDIAERLADESGTSAVPEGERDLIESAQRMLRTVMDGSIEDHERSTAYAALSRTVAKLRSLAIRPGSLPAMLISAGADIRGIEAREHDPAAERARHLA